MIFRLENAQLDHLFAHEVIDEGVRNLNLDDISALKRAFALEVDIAVNLVWGIPAGTEGVFAIFINLDDDAFHNFPDMSPVTFVGDFPLMPHKERSSFFLELIGNLVLHLITRGPLLTAIGKAAHMVESDFIEEFHRLFEVFLGFARETGDQGSP